MVFRPSKEQIIKSINENPKAQLRGNEDDIFLKKPKKTKQTKQTKVEIVYDRIMNNPEISNSSKLHLKRNTKNGTVLDMEDFIEF